MIAAREIRAADRSPEQHVAHEGDLGFLVHEHDMARRVSGAVHDVEREVAELKAKGVRFEEYDTPGMKTEDGIATAGGAKAAWFKDSEGNIMALIQTL